MGPPDTPRVVGSCRVRSGDMAVQLCPSLVDLNSTLAPVYSTCASCGEIKSGAVHWKRYFPSPAGWPSGLSGQGLMIRKKPVRWSTRARKPELSRSEEHTSELQSRLHLVCRLLLEKKKKRRHCVALDVNTDVVTSQMRA